VTDEELRAEIKKIEDTASDFRFDLQISDAFRDLFQRTEKDLTEEQKKRFEWEFNLFRLATKNSFNNEGMKTDRFHPMAHFQDGRIFPDPDGFPKEAIDYFESRAKDSTNPILRSRYLDFLWEKSNLPNKHVIAQEAIKAYLDASETYKAEESAFERTDCLQRAAGLATILESKVESKPISEAVSKKILERVETYAKAGDYRWTLELIEISAYRPKLFGEENLKRFIEIIDEAIKSYQDQGNQHLQRSFIELKKHLLEVLKASPEEIKATDESIAESYVAEAEAKSGSPLVKGHFLHEAVKAYSKIGNKEKTNQLIEEMKKAGKEAIDTHEFVEIKSTVKIPKEDIEKLKKSLGEHQDVPQQLGINSNFLPDWERAKVFSKEMAEKYPLSHIFGKTHFRGKPYPVRRSDSKEDIDEDNVMEQFDLDNKLKLNFLTGFLLQLKDEGKVTYRDFEQYFRKAEFIEPETLETILEGLKRFFEGDYLHSLETLTLQLEDVLRVLLANLGAQTTKQNTSGFEEITLSPILKQIRPDIPETLYRYLCWMLDDFRGPNLRHEVAHGFIKKSRVDARQVVGIIHVFCILIANTKKVYR